MVVIINDWFSVYTIRRTKRNPSFFGTRGSRCTKNFEAYYSFIMSCLVDGISCQIVPSET